MHQTLRIGATRVEAPTVEQQHGTRWQVATWLPDGTQRTFDRVEIHGASVVVALPEHESPGVNPRTFITPCPNVPVYGFTSRHMERLDDRRSGAELARTKPLCGGNTDAQPVNDR